MITPALISAVVSATAAIHRGSSPAPRKMSASGATILAANMANASHARLYTTLPSAASPSAAASSNIPKSTKISMRLFEPMHGGRQQFSGNELCGPQALQDRFGLDPMFRRAAVDTRKHAAATRNVGNRGRSGPAADLKV